jgi:hypothetical protein
MVLHSLLWLVVYLTSFFTSDVGTSFLSSHPTISRKLGDSGYEYLEMFVNGGEEISMATFYNSA